MSSTLLVLQHIACEPPAVFEDQLRFRGLDLIRVGLDEGERRPDRCDFAATIVIGGPMGAYEEDLHPWLVEEKRHTATRPSRSPDHASSTIPLAYGLLGRWLERVARVPAQAIG